MADDCCCIYDVENARSKMTEHVQQTHPEGLQSCHELSLWLHCDPIAILWKEIGNIYIYGNVICKDNLNNDFAELMTTIMTITITTD